MMNVLNYQGNKNKLMEFINPYIRQYLQKNKALLDIFCGGGAVCQYYYNEIPVYANDIEIYSNLIAKSILNPNELLFDKEWKNEFMKKYQKNYNFIFQAYSNDIEIEEECLEKNDAINLIELYKSFPTLWNGYYSKLTNSKLTWGQIDFTKQFVLMTVLYSSNYFGIKQAVELDSLRYAIEKTNKKYNKAVLFTALFNSMNNCVFSKDGHMAQPLNQEKNKNRLIKTRKLSILNCFMDFISKYESNLPIFNNKCFNYDLKDLLNQNNIFKEIGCVYADPPYTDMQYSRYYHLLNTIAIYEADSPTIKQGKFTNGLYLNNRKQSDLSTKKSCLTMMIKLMETCKHHNVNLVISFGYPNSNSDEKNDRYVMNIDDLINSSKVVFGDENVDIHKLDYFHSNHRNSRKKKVVEYLICCRGCYD